MGSSTLIGSCFSWRNHQLQQIIPLSTSHISRGCVQQRLIINAKVAPDTDSQKIDSRDAEEEMGKLMNTKRRSVFLSAVSLASAVFGIQREGFAVVNQGPLAGRIPGLSRPDEQGWRTYRRPDEKSGGHGVGWSSMIPYSFSVPPDWEEVPVSIADPGGTEIDLRFDSSKEGRLNVVVAPVLRFTDNLGGNVRIEQIGGPEVVINAVGPEVIGDNVEGKVLRMDVSEHSGRTYYEYELKPPHALITATAAGNRLYLFNVFASGLQWKKHEQVLKKIADSFRVIEEKSSV